MGEGKGLTIKEKIVFFFKLFFPKALPLREELFLAASLSCRKVVRIYERYTFTVGEGIANSHLQNYEHPPFQYDLTMHIN